MFRALSVRVRRRQTLESFAKTTAAVAGQTRLTVVQGAREKFNRRFLLVVGVWKCIIGIRVQARSRYGWDTDLTILPQPRNLKLLDKKNRIIL